MGDLEPYAGRSSRDIALMEAPLMEAQLRPTVIIGAHGRNVFAAESIPWIELSWPIVAFTSRSGTA